jgi:hypothetical protein
MVEGALEVLVEDDRDTAGLAEAAIGEADAVGLDVPGRRRFVRVARHRSRLSTSIRPSTGREARRPTGSGHVSDWDIL